jgi:hypothetical protein
MAQLPRPPPPARTRAPARSDQRRRTRPRELRSPWTWYLYCAARARLARPRRRNEDVMMTMKTDGPFYSAYKTKNSSFAPATFACAEETMRCLLQQAHSEERPGILLGKVQSGKTRAFVTLLALAFDNGYETAVILTKNSVPLVDQTLKRLNSDLADFIAAKDLRVINIMNQAGSFTKYELEHRKHVFVGKKQADNLARLQDLLADPARYPRSPSAKCLIIDDEADSASVGFAKDEAKQITAKTIAKLVNQLRQALPGCAYLQVTATPDSLFLQPKDIELGGEFVFLPIRPAFSVLVPVPDDYVGGETYFGAASRSTEVTIENCIHKRVPLSEFDCLKKHDGRTLKLNRLLETDAIAVFRQAIVTFLVGGTIQRLNGMRAGKKSNALQYSFLVHTEAGRNAHRWQERLTRALLETLGHAAQADAGSYRTPVTLAWEDLARSLSLAAQPVPDLEQTVDAVREALLNEHVKVTRVNSDAEIQALLDDTGQLELCAPLNIFLGGQALDRGVTIANLLGFFYGRRPKTFQQDTVLQHARMFGYRRGDLPVTRFYTTPTIRQAMTRMEEFDSALRAAIEAEKQGSGSGAVQVIRVDAKGEIKPCSPTKILATKAQTLRPGVRLVPFGFQTHPQTGKHGIGKTIDALTRRLEKEMPFDAAQPKVVSLQFSIDVLEEIRTTLVFDPDGPQFSWDAAKAALKFLSAQHPVPAERAKVLLWTTRGRDVGRMASELSHATYVETPDSAKTEGKMAATFAIHMPILFLLGQRGRKQKGWQDAEFYWPVIRAQQNAPGAIFADDKSISGA